MKFRLKIICALPSLALLYCLTGISSADEGSLKQKLDSIGHLVVTSKSIDTQAIELRIKIHDLLADEIAKDEIQICDENNLEYGSFMHRYVASMNTLWHPPKGEVGRKIGGITTMLLVFNQKGVIVKTQLLYSSGSNTLDDEAARALDTLNPLGRPKSSFTGNEFKMIVFFPYDPATAKIPGPKSLLTF